jgi:predicted amidohydrolase YtcJ
MTSAGTWFVNGRIRTLDPSRPLAEWFEVRAGSVAAVGSGPPNPTGRVIDLGGRLALPGFVDAHIHLWKVGDLLNYTMDLRGSRSIREIQARLAAFAAANPDLPVIKARGFNEAHLAEGRLLDRRDLDAAVPDRPVYALRTCAHIAVVNSAALAELDLDRGAAAPPGGEVRLDERGRPTGVFTETALGLVAPLVSGITIDQLKVMIRSAGRELLRHGVVAVVDPAVGPDLMTAYRELERDGELPVRVNAIAIGIPDGAAVPLPLPAPYRSRDLTVDTVKFFADGGLSGGTAALSRPYLGGNYRGVLRLAEAQFGEAAELVHRAGLRIATHAIGDEAIELVLDCYQRLAHRFPGGLRHRIEHLGLPSDVQKDRIRDLGVEVATQPIFLDELGRNFRAVLDPGFLAQCYPVRSLLDRGIPTAFSSDAPVVRNLNPLRCIQAAVTRCTEDGEVIAEAEGVSVAEGLAAHGTTAAAISGWGGELGRLSAGYSADFVVLDRDPEESPAGGLSSIEVLETYRDGRRVFGA